MLPLLLLTLLPTLTLSAPTTPALTPRTTPSACTLAVRAGITWTATALHVPPFGAPTVDFTLTNSAVNYTHTCSGMAHFQTPFDGVHRFECYGSGGKGSASFAYDYEDRTAGKLLVRQEFECDDGEAGRPYYVAEGTAVVTVELADVEIVLESIRGVL
ncbi:hypothetical protein QBC39DRAFT_335074 [Podospora conica]|nr:hypothetical protein QBC39DRAFT_335074 [Schizothecium conicum]